MRFKFLKGSFFLWSLVVLFWALDLTYRPSLWTIVGALSVMSTIFGLFLLLTGKWRTSLLWLTIVGVALYLLNLGKRLFWKDRLKFEDFTVFTDPTNFETVFHYPLECGLATLLLIGLIFFCIKSFYVDKTKLTVMNRLTIATLSIIVGVLGAYYALQNGQQKWMENMRKGSNVIANILMSSKLQYTSPASLMVSGEKFPTPMDHIGKDLSKPLSDIVLILQESTMDPRSLKGIDPESLPTLTMFNSPYATQQGALRVHTYGGGTWRSEFSALTGLSSSDFGVLAGSVFYSAVFHVQDSLWSRLKRAGYKIIIVTPFAEGSYNSGKAYRQLGVDEMIHVADLGWPGSNRKNVWDIPTSELLAMVRKVMERDHSGPIAVYALTMREHGPYPAQKNHSLRATESKVDVGQLASLAEYVDRLKSADKAVVEFDQWIQQRARPTVMVRFGDHQPALSWKAGQNSSEINPEYITNYALVDNQLQGKETIPALTDIIFLPSLILKRIGVEMGDFYKTALTMYELCDGRYQDCSDKRLLKAFQNEIYVNQRIAE